MREGKRERERSVIDDDGREHRAEGNRPTSAIDATIRVAPDAHCFFTLVGELGSNT